MEIPEGLNVIQYATHLLQEVASMPLKGNIELMADCLTSIQKSKKLTDIQSYKYMARAIKLAKEQGVEVDRFFLMNADYLKMRPPSKQEQYEPIDWKAVRKHQASPEFDAAWKEMQEKCAKAFGIPISKGGKK